ncbi:LPS export ABC transporter permease LptF [Roseibium suaedae]|uniref:Lipopolysaccharide export system permease protein n=1 Tax=Roseibium suaedae TaxID=735517 RepID=A0A1M7LDI5_9HYPH|nr:LPS export ABC transporter permease LptF [Roseibium suaedae]SHM75669.1 lipopolysaccharide export system permease protein [Roseibium suaedae]
MKILERYIIRRAFMVFAMTLAAMTGVVWATQALRQLDLVTSKGQTLIQFISITMLAMPFLVVIVAPFALMIALVLVLNALSGDSELIVINATGGSRFLVLKPVLIFAVTVMVLCGTLSLYVAPLGLSQLREEITRVRADLVANIVQPGRFISVEDGLTFHIRNRSGNGTLEGLLLHDIREPDSAFTYQAETGHIVEMQNRTLLVMQNGTIQRKPQADGDISIVRFQSYAFDLSSLIPQASTPVYKASERSTADLMSPSPDDAYATQHPDKLLQELHERFSQPLYPVAFSLIVFAFLGRVRTTRQNRNMAVLGAIVGCVTLRTAGFGVTAIAGEGVLTTALLYFVPLLGIVLSMWTILKDERLTPPKWAGNRLEAIGEWIERVTDRINGRTNGVS